VAVLRAALQADGVRLLEGAEPRAARADGQDILLDVPGHPPLRGSHLLVAAGREPDVSGLGLEAADIAATPRGIVVDARLRTTNRRVFALGDVTGGPAFTHVAGAHAAVALQNILFGIPARFDATALPRVTYTEPEIAQVGLTEAEAREAGHAASAILAPLSDNDRAVADGATEGFAKLVLGPRGRILGGTLVAPHAGEAIGLVGLAIGRRLGAAALARALLPYPTIAEAVKRAAGAHFAPALFGARTRLLVRLLQRLLP
jgi:pyruvate/2-oxoglutarate dehydrogenase complex dihydrolipoamide dehydrogenase (E3) component